MVTALVDGVRYKNLMAVDWTGWRSPFVFGGEVLEHPVGAKERCRGKDFSSVAC